MKKLLAFVLVLVLVLSVTSALAYSPEEPITILFWHTRGSGANLTAVEDSVKAFNETVGKEKGIVVEQVYIGSYADLHAKTQLATQTAEQPVIAVSGCTYAPQLLDDGLLADLMPYAIEDGFDVSNLFDAFMTAPGNSDTTLCSIPYVRSTAVLFYNKTMADAKNLTLPDQPTWDEVAAFSTAMMEKDSTGEITVDGFQLTGGGNGFLYTAMYRQLGEDLLSFEGDAYTRTSPALDGHAVLDVFTFARNAVDAGWWRANDVTDGNNKAQERFYQGKLACLVASTSSLANIMKNMTANNYEVGVVRFPAFEADKPASMVGGGQLVVISKGNTEEQIRAGWEYIKFALSDEQVYLNSVNTGYLPVTKSVASYEQMTNFWAEHPTYKVAYDQLDYAVLQEAPQFMYIAEFNANFDSELSLLLQERSVTPEEAVAHLKEYNAHLLAK